MTTGRINQVTHSGKDADLSNVYLVQWIGKTLTQPKPTTCQCYRQTAFPGASHPFGGKYGQSWQEKGTCYKHCASLCLIRPAHIPMNVASYGIQGQSETILCPHSLDCTPPLHLFKALSINYPCTRGIHTAWHLTRLAMSGHWLDQLALSHTSPLVGTVATSFTFTLYEYTRHIEVAHTKMWRIHHILQTRISSCCQSQFANCEHICWFVTVVKVSSHTCWSQSTSQTMSSWLVYYLSFGSFAHSSKWHLRNHCGEALYGADRRHTGWILTNRMRKLSERTIPPRTLIVHKHKVLVQSEKVFPQRG